MVDSLTASRFYGKALPRPRFNFGLLLGRKRAFCPPPVQGALLEWADSADWRQGGRSLKKRFMGRLNEAHINSTDFDTQNKRVKDPKVGNQKKDSKHVNQNKQSRNVASVSETRGSNALLNSKKSNFTPTEFQKSNHISRIQEHSAPISSKEQKKKKSRLHLENPLSIFDFSDSD